jgi:hypothetical protein
MAIVSTSPVDGAIEIYIREKVSITFDVDMDPSTLTSGNLIIYNQDWDIAETTIAYDSPTRTVTITANVPFLIRHQYKVVIIGGMNGVASVADAWGDRTYLPSNYDFSFTTNDGRFYATPSTVVPSGVDPSVIYPPGIDYYTAFAYRSSRPADRESNISPSGVYLDANGLPTITLCFNKPVSLASITGSGLLCANEPIKITMRDVVGDPYLGPQTDLTAHGTWTSTLWQARFTLDANTYMSSNKEIAITIPSNLMATDGTVMGEKQEIYFTTTYDPLYVGVYAIRLKLGDLIADIPDDTINRIIYRNCILANWYSFQRNTFIRPFVSQYFTGSEITMIRPQFVVSPLTGPPEYVKRYVDAKTCLDLLKARYMGELDRIFLDGGPGASKALADLKVSDNPTTLYAATVGPIIQALEGGDPKSKDPITRRGEVGYWLDHITGIIKIKIGLNTNWGMRDPRNPPKRTDWITGTGGGSSSGSGGGWSGGS